MHALESGLRPITKNSVGSMVGWWTTSTDSQRSSSTFTVYPATSPFLRNVQTLYRSGLRTGRPDRVVIVVAVVATLEMLSLIMLLLWSVLQLHWRRSRRLLTLCLTLSLIVPRRLLRQSWRYVTYAATTGVGDG
jgi:hypothetical protein